ncbi:uncharacterized protein LOC143063116 [Mytilus galloprovincialis]|uniref:uncharacterized protein LOC143063116 n=1 Tax=Mytilus galloprovincialis TaxID=29158 RepID=UPI003F7CD12D
MEDIKIIKTEPQINLLEHSFQNVKKFAEILYKCKLCTSLPSILTSEESFLTHVNNTHYQDSDALKKCRNCRLKFRTKEDLWAHQKLMHSDFGSEDESSDDENGKFEIAWQITTDHADLNSVDQLKRKKGKKEKHSRKQKKLKNLTAEDVEQDPHVVITHGIEQSISPAPQNDSEDLKKLTNQIASDASPKGSMGSNGNVYSSTPEFGKYTKLIREGGNIVYFCQVCNWKSQMKVMFTEHCKSTAHLIKVTVAEQNDSHDKNTNENSSQNKYEKRGHFMSFLDEKINYYINKRLSSESINPEIEEKDNQSETRKESLTTTNDDHVISEEIKKEPADIPDNVSIDIDQVETKNNVHTNRRKRKVISRLLKNSEIENNNWSDDDSDSIPQPTSNKQSRQYIDSCSDSQFKIQKSTAQFSPLNLKTMEDESQSSKTDEQSIVSEEKETVGREQSAGNDKRDMVVKDVISKAVDSELYRSSMFMYRCSLCPFVCNDITEYRVHFENEHEPEQQTDVVTESGYTDCKTEQWKVLRIKELLPDIIVAHPRGNVSRDLLLQKASMVASEPEIALWGPACNKALRELFPDSLAQRKGKYKKTYFFGVALIDQVQQEEAASAEGNDVDFSPLRDMTQDMDKILQHLHTIVRWRGDLEAGVSRDDVLHILGRKIDDSEVQHWGVQCNRAIRILFPHVQMKRKGKYKTTVYFGVTFSDQVTKEDFASLTAPKSRPQKPVVKDDGIKPKLTWRDAIRTIGGKAFTAQDKKSIITKGWGPLMSLGGPSTSDTKETSSSPSMFMQDQGLALPNVTSEMINSAQPFKESQELPPRSGVSPQNMSLLRYHLTSSEFNMYYKFGAELEKTIWQSKDELEQAKVDREKLAAGEDTVNSQISNSGDEKSNDADDESSQSTLGDGKASSFFNEKSDNPNVIKTDDGIMYIKQEVNSDQDS